MFEKIVFFLLILRTSDITNADKGRKIELEDLKVESLNGDYFDLSVTDVGINYRNGPDNTLNIRVKIIKPLPDNIKIKFTIWIGMFGRYDVPSGISRELDLCNEATSKIYVDMFTLPMGVDSCPAKVGDYKNEDFYPEMNFRIPDILIRTHLMVDVHISADTVKLANFKVFLKV